MRRHKIQVEDATLEWWHVHTRAEFRSADPIERVPGALASSTVPPSIGLLLIFSSIVW